MRIGGKTFSIRSLGVKRCAALKTFQNILNKKILISQRKFMKIRNRKRRVEKSNSKKTIKKIYDGDFKN